MNLSFDNTWVRLAALSDEQLESVGAEFNSKLSLDEMKFLRDSFSEFGSKADLVTEWGIEGIARLHGSVKDRDLVANMARFYFEAVKTPRFRKIVDEYSETVAKRSIYYKNLLDFTVGDLYGIKEIYEAPEPDPTLPQRLPEGAEVIASYKGYHIVEADTVEAVCTLGDSTDWCTRHPESALEYLDEGPLYVIYAGRRKIGLLSIARRELRDRKNEPILVDEYIGEILWHTGLLKQIIDDLEGDGENTMRLPAVVRQWLQYPKKEVESYIANKPYMAIAYAHWILKGPWPEAEAAIATKSMPALDYARDVLEGRFPLGEEAILQDDYAVAAYLTFLKKTDREGYLEVFSRAFPGKQALP